MKTSPMPVRAGQVTPESDDATGPASNGGTKVQQNAQPNVATSNAWRKRNFIHATEPPSLRAVGDLLRGIGGPR